MMSLADGPLNARLDETHRQKNKNCCTHRDSSPRKVLKDRHLGELKSLVLHWWIFNFQWQWTHHHHWTVVIQDLLVGGITTVVVFLEGVCDDTGAEWYHHLLKGRWRRTLMMIFPNELFEVKTSLKSPCELLQFIFAVDD